MWISLGLSEGEAGTGRNGESPDNRERPSELPFAGQLSVFRLLLPDSQSITQYSSGVNGSRIRFSTSARARDQRAGGFGTHFAKPIGMSEGPEVHRISAELNQEFASSCIVAIESRLKKARAWLEEHPGLVEGKEVLSVEAAGKNIIWRLEEDIYFQMHLLMFGKIRTYSLRHHFEPDRTFRARIVSTSRQAVLLNVQVFNIGVGDPYQEIETLRELGPDLCSVPFDKELFLERLNEPENLEREIGPVLLDQRVAAGVGNYLKSDILFECRINPWTTVSELTREEQDCLANTIPEIGQRALHNRGQTVTDEVMEQLIREVPSPNWWHKHWVFRHTNRPCKVCGTPIRQRRQGPGEGRMTFYCPYCQKVSA